MHTSCSPADLTVSTTCAFSVLPKNSLTYGGKTWDLIPNPIILALWIFPIIQIRLSRIWVRATRLLFPSFCFLSEKLPQSVTETLDLPPNVQQQEHRKSPQRYWNYNHFLNKRTKTTVNSPEPNFSTNPFEEIKPHDRLWPLVHWLSVSLRIHFKISAYFSSSSWPGSSLHFTSPNSI